MDFKNIPAGRLIGMTSNMIRRVMDKIFSDMPYSAAETACISFISDQMKENPNAAVFQRDVEKEFNLRSSTASETIKNLEAKGLLYRESIDGDGRKKKLILTQKALDYDAENKTKLHHLEETLTKNISPEDLDVYRRVSKQMIDNLHMEEING